MLCRISPILACTVFGWKVRHYLHLVVYAIPYSGISANSSLKTDTVKEGSRYKKRLNGKWEWVKANKDLSVTVPNFIGELLDDYYQVDGAPLGEKNPKWLQDDYVKFIRFGQWRIECTGHGILGFITNHSYLDNPTFRGMRQSLINAFTDIYILNLHGNTKKKEIAPDGSNSLSLTQAAGSGQFDYKISPVLPTPQVPDVSYPSTVIDSIDFTFTFVPTVPAASTSSVQALMENPGIWQKTINLVPSTATKGNVSLSFSLNPDQLNQQFDTIDKETGLTTSTRVVTVQATVIYGKDSFVQSLPLTLKDSVLEVGGNLQQQQSIGTGKFDYVINLKPNSIYDTTTLKPPTAAVPTTLPSFDLSGKPVVVTTSSPSTLQPGQTAFVNLIDKINVNFGYQFVADKPVNNLKTIVDIIATLEVPQSWSKNFILLHNEQSGNITVNFPIDVASYTQLVKSIITETGVNADSYNLTITANIHTTGDTAFGPINETFSPTMSGTIKNNVLVWDKELTTSKTGAISQTNNVGTKSFGLSIPAAEIFFGILSFIFLLCLLGMIMLYSKNRGMGPSSFEREIEKIRKKYGTRIAESISNSEIEGEMPVSMNSMEDLIKISDELGKPIVHQSGGSLGDVESYYVIDGNTKYEYSFSKGEADVTNDS